LPEKYVIERAHRDAEEGKSPATQAGEFVREEIEHVRQGKHGASSLRQAIAIGLSKARRAGIKLPPPKAGRTSRNVRDQARRDLTEGSSGSRSKPSPRRSRAVSQAKGSDSASRSALARQAEESERRRGSAARHRAGMASVRTQGRAGLRRGARKAARTPSPNGL
jgi:hypothetical protein